MLKEVVCIVTATLIILTIFLTQSQQHDDTPRAFERKIRRLGQNQPLFDPLGSMMKRMSEKERQEAKHRRDVLAAETNELFYDEGKTNIMIRLMLLFPAIDTSPQDDYVDYYELESWITQRAIDSMNYRTQAKLEELDKDGDGLVSFQECFPQFTLQHIEKNINNIEHGEVGWWLKQFKNVDSDHNGALNLYEYRDFLYPEDSRNDRIQLWFLNQKLSRWDIDGDQQLNLFEFVNGVYKTYKSYFQYETGETAPSSESIFFKLDTNGDRLLRAEELKVIVQYLNPGELIYAKHYTRYLINEADEDKDGRLNLDEMVNHSSVFYNTLLDNERYVNAEDSYHEEL